MRLRRTVHARINLLSARCFKRQYKGRARGIVSSAVNGWSRLRAIRDARRPAALVRATCFFVAVLCTASATSAAETVDGRVGQRVENFSLPDFHGQPHALDDYPDQVIVLAFLGTECPLSKLYALRLVELAAEFTPQRVVFLGVDSNLQDSLTDIGVFARSHRVAFPLLKDNNNELADRLRAVRTPEVFLLDRQRIVRYWGRIDDQYGFKTGAGYAKPKLEERSLANALSEVLQGKSVTHPVASPTVV